MGEIAVDLTNPYAYTERKYCVGVDLGQSFDPTAICVVEKITKGIASSWRAKGYRGKTYYHVRHLERLPLNVSYIEQVEYINRLLRQPPLDDPKHFLGCFVDYTGVGRAVFDIFKKARIPKLEGVTITAGSDTRRSGGVYSVPKTELVSKVQAEFHNDSLKIAPELDDAKALLRELQDFRVKFTSAGNATFGARNGAHDDLVLSLALALFGATRGPNCVIASV